MTLTNKGKTKWVDDVIVPTSEVSREQMRGLGDLPVDASPGAREVSMLTAISQAHGKALPQVFEALKYLENLPDWSGQFLVADKPNYNWRTSPWRHYDSFADFYQRECAPVWGEWCKLQEIYLDILSGNITPRRATTEIKRHADAARALALSVEANAKHGTNQHTGGGYKKNVTSSRGNSAAYRVSTLKRDDPDVADRLAAGEFKSVSEAERAANAADDIKRLERIRKNAKPEVWNDIVAWFDEHREPYGGS